jgi:AraC-like DNA-binding protein
MSNFANVTAGPRQWEANSVLPRHRHDQGYAAIILSGGYEEVGSRGRFHAGPGDVLLHGAFDAHLDRFRTNGANILNLVLSETESTEFGIGCVTDADAIARTAETDPAASIVQLREQFCGRICKLQDWPDALARDLINRPNCRLDDWADTNGLAAETVSRGFRKIFGLTPAEFRAEARVLRALLYVVGSAQPLVAVAAMAGFADHAHMSRAVKMVTGASPKSLRWRRLAQA